MIAHTRGRARSVLAAGILGFGPALAACGDGPPDPAHESVVASNETTIERYERAFRFDAPVSCSPFVFYRVVDTKALIAEYYARMADDGNALDATYSVVPGDPLPLRIDLSTATGALLLTVTADEHLARFLDGAQRPILEVRDYLGAAPVSTAGPGRISLSAGVTARDVSDALDLARCMLPDQRELGFVAGFFENRRDTVVEGQRGVASHDADAPPLLPAWDGSTTILGAFYGAVSCARPTEDPAAPLAWQCP